MADVKRQARIGAELLCPERRPIDVGRRLTFPDVVSASIVLGRISRSTDAEKVMVVQALVSKAANLRSRSLAHLAYEAVLCGLTQPFTCEVSVFAVALSVIRLLVVL